MDYEINRNTVMIIPISDKKSKVIELDCEYVVESDALSIMKHSCLYFGSSFEGRISCSKEILGSIYKAPIVIEESRNIIFFPIKSYVTNQNVWISINNLISYNRHDRQTVINFKNSKQILVNAPYFTIDNQVLRATMLESVFRKRKNEEKTV